jgi:hypothetical protein
MDGVIGVAREPNVESVLRSFSILLPSANATFDPISDAQPTVGLNLAVGTEILRRIVRQRPSACSRNPQRQCGN